MWGFKPPQKGGFGGGFWGVPADTPSVHACTQVCTPDTPQKGGVSREPFFAQKIAKILENSGPKSLENALHLGGRLKNAIFLRKKTFFGTQNHPPQNRGVRRCTRAHTRAHPRTPRSGVVLPLFGPFFTQKTPLFLSLKNALFCLKMTIFKPKNAFFAQKNPFFAQKSLIFAQKTPFFHPNRLLRTGRISRQISRPGAGKSRPPSRTRFFVKKCEFLCQKKRIFGQKMPFFAEKTHFLPKKGHF